MCWNLYDSKTGIHRTNPELNRLDNQYASRLEHCALFTAVVAGPHAATQIQTGQQLRVNGDAGYVELLDSSPD